MQTLSTYLLETDAQDEEQLEIRFDSVCECISEWLVSKGVKDATQSSGSFESLTNNGDGRFLREKLSPSVGILEQSVLIERSRSGQTFTTRLVATAFNGKVSVFCSLVVENTSSLVAPVPNDPRCPAVVRTLLDKFPDWKLNKTPLGSSKPDFLSGDLAGRKLADDIRNDDRAIPVIVVSEIEGETLWPRLSEELGYDLAALAHVIRVDENAAWALTDELGKLHSCYLGAVRLYWPPRKVDGESSFYSTVWTASKLLSNDSDGNGLFRFRSMLRRLLMSTASLSISQPHAVREIRRSVMQDRIEQLKSRLSSDSEELEIARLYTKENEELKDQLEHLEEELIRAVARAEAAEHALSQVKSPELSDEDQSKCTEEKAEPSSGDVRFYKKSHDKGAYDVLVEVDDCGHSSWQNSSKADKARKGLERLTKRRDWKTLQHCGSCTGGGMWKVRW